MDFTALIRSSLIHTNQIITLQSENGLHSNRINFVNPNPLPWSHFCQNNFIFLLKGWNKCQKNLRKFDFYFFYIQIIFLIEIHWKNQCRISIMQRRKRLCIFVQNICRMQSTKLKSKSLNATFTSRNAFNQTTTIADSSPDHWLNNGCLVVVMLLLSLSLN